MKKNLHSQNLHVQINQLEILKAHSGAGIRMAPTDEPPVIVTPPPKIGWNTIVA